MGQEVRVMPQVWNHRGEAVVPGAKKSLLVSGGIPGEMAWVRVVHEGQNQDYGHWLAGNPPSPVRTKPPCRKVNNCGGCSLMHLTSAGQETALKNIVRHEFERLDLPAPISAFHGSQPRDEYRHIVKVGFGYSDRGHIRTGAWGRRNRRIVPIPDCLVTMPVHRKLMKALAHHVIELAIRPWEEESGRGVLRAAVLRVSRTTGEVLITLVAGRRIRELGDLAERLGEVPEVVGVWLHLNEEPGNAIFDRQSNGSIGVRPLTGRGWIEERIGPISYRIGPADFFQTHPEMAETLYATTLARLGLAAGDPVIDLYCGVGGFALQAAHETGWALGVEEGDGAVLAARESARRNKVTAEFVAGRVEEVLPDLARRFADAHPVVIVNPARRGLEPGVIEGIKDLQPRRLAYISCNPRALARDLAEFIGAGMILENLELFDMFPNTHHVETLALLRPKAAFETTRRAPRRKAVRK